MFQDAGIDSMLEKICEFIDEEISHQKTAVGLRNQKCHAVRSGLNGLLDIGETEIRYILFNLTHFPIQLARRTYGEVTNDVFEMVNSYSGKSVPQT
jgi:DNA mismatch repair protein MSH4